jgi:acyl carrier protein
MSKNRTSTDEVRTSLIEIIKDLASDWDTDFSGPLSGETRLMSDLAFESIDVVHLLVAIQHRFGGQDIPFERLLMVDGRYVADLTISQVAEFLHDFV